MARRWQTVLVSMMAHVAALFLLVAIPLLAMDGLPGIPSMTTYVPVEVRPPALPTAPQRPPSTIAPAALTAGAPVEAPTRITPEVPAQPPALTEVAVTGTAGVPGGVGVATGDVTAVPPPRAAEPEPVRPGGNVKAPTRTLFVAPVYPPTALAARVSGSVIIEAVIGADGHVRDARILRSIPLLDDAALLAVRQWRYTPTMLNGAPVPVVMTVTVQFSLGG